MRVGKEKSTSARFHVSSLLAQNFCDGVSDDRTGLFNLPPGQTSGQTDLECRKHRLLRSDSIWEGLEASDENAICKNLWRQSENDKGRKALRKVSHLIYDILQHELLVLDR